MALQSVRSLAVLADHHPRAFPDAGLRKLGARKFRFDPGVVPAKRCRVLERSLGRCVQNVTGTETEHAADRLMVTENGDNALAINQWERAAQLLDLKAAIVFDMCNGRSNLVLMGRYGDTSRPTAFDVSDQIGRTIHFYRDTKLAKSPLDEAVNFLLETAG
jgi:hypothetical protein